MPEQDKPFFDPYRPPELRRKIPEVPSQFRMEPPLEPTPRWISTPLGHLPEYGRGAHWYRYINCFPKSLPVDHPLSTRVGSTHKNWQSSCKHRGGMFQRFPKTEQGRQDAAACRDVQRKLRQFDEELPDLPPSPLAEASAAGLLEGGNPRHRIATRYGDTWTPPEQSWYGNRTPGYYEPDFMRFDPMTSPQQAMQDVMFPDMTVAHLNQSGSDVRRRR